MKKNIGLILLLIVAGLYLAALVWSIINDGWLFGLVMIIVSAVIGVLFLAVHLINDSNNISNKKEHDEKKEQAMDNGRY